MQLMPTYLRIVANTAYSVNLYFTVTRDFIGFRVEH